jgi:glycerol-3-phosphate acyltransferase PlsY
MDILVSYLIGAIPTGYIFGRLKGIDLRKHGSGNVGATNAWRVLGKRLGICTLLIDILKGVLVVVVIAKFFPIKTIEDVFLRKFICGLAAILGHNFPVYLKFRGGKGVATSVGVVLGLTPKALGASFFVWICVLLLTRYVSVASMAGGILLPIFSILFGYPKTMHWFSTVIALLLLIQHRSNIKRLLKGEEKKLFSKHSL